MTTTAEVPALNAPKVNKVSSTDTTITLKLTAPSKLYTPKDENYKVYYKLESEQYTVSGNSVSGNQTPSDPGFVAYVEQTGASQNYTMQVSEARKFGYYNLYVSMVYRYYYDGEWHDSQVGTATILKKVATTAPAYEVKLNLTKKATKIISGQSDVVMALPKFSKATTYVENLNAEVLDENGSSMERAELNPDARISARVENGQVLVSVGPQTIAGKYTLIVTADAGQDTNMVASTASMQFTVTPGILAYNVNLPKEIYKAEKKAVSQKVQILAFGISSSGYYETIKNPKIISTLYKYDSNTQTTNELPRGVSFKSNTLKLDKNYQPENGSETFLLRIEANDYDGNPRTLDYTFAVTNQLTEIDHVEVYSVKEDRVLSEQERAALLGSRILTNEYNEEYGYWQQKPAYRIAAYNADGDEIPAVNLQYKANHKNVTVNSYTGELYIYNFCQKVTITVSMKDGSSSKKLTGLGLKRPVPDDLAFYYENSFGPDTEPNIELTSIKSNAETFQFWIYYKEADSNEYKYAGSDYVSQFELSVKGAKLGESKNSAYNYVTMQAPTATITLKNKVTGVKKTLTITYENFSKTAPPQVSTKDALYENYPGTQTLTYTGKKEIEYDYVQVIGSADLGWDIYDGKVLPIDHETNSFSIPFNSELGTGTYKLQFVYGYMVGSTFIPKTKAASATVKIQKRPTFKLTSSYTLSPKEGAAAVLTGKGSASNIRLNTDTANAQLLNANIKGSPNDFTAYFELVSDDQGNLVIRLNPYLPWSSLQYIQGKLAKSDLTGYVRYYVAGVGTQTEKITIKFASMDKKYAANPKTVTWNPADTTNYPITDIYFNGKKIDIRDVYCAANGWDAQIDYSGTDKCIRLKPTVDAPKEKTHSITLYIINNDSVWSMYTPEDDASERKEFFTKYGTKVTVNVKVSKKAAFG